jgi:vacuolar-type H+-ATPase subunit H
MRKWFLKSFGLLFIVWITMNAGFAQQQKMSDAQKKKEKVERSYKKAYAKARKKTIKHRREIQTDETRQRMDEADKRARAYNKKNDPGFLERYFKTKKPRKNKKY